MAHVLEQKEELLSERRVTIMKLQDQLGKATEESSKQFVGNNSNAKAKHFNSIKMELNLAQQEKAKLTDKMKTLEKKEETNLQKVGETYAAQLALMALVHSKCGQAFRQEQQPKFQSVDFGLLKMKESISQCVQLLNKAN